MISYSLDQQDFEHRIGHKLMAVLTPAKYIHTHFSAISFGVSAVSILPSTVEQNSSLCDLTSSQTIIFDEAGIFCLTFFAMPKPMLPKPMKPYVASGGVANDPIVCQIRVED